MARPPARRARRRRPRLGLQRLIPAFHPRDVTTIGEEAPSELPTGLWWRQVEQLYRSGLHPAIALHVMHHGRPILDRVVGHVDNPPGGPTGALATPDTLFNLFSASKIVSAALIHALIEDGVLRLSDRVVDYLPGFGKHGKEGITIRHLLNHTAGIPHMPAQSDLESRVTTWRDEIALLDDLVPLTAPGVRNAYHPMSAWFLLGLIVERATGVDLDTLLHARLLDPLGFERVRYGVPPADVDRVARHAYTGPPTPGLMSSIFQRTVGADLAEAVPLTNSAPFLTATLPSANVIATPRETSRFLQMLLQGGALDGVRVLRPETIQRMVRDVTPVQFDGTFGFPMRYGLGVMMGGNRFSLFGLGTRGAFGHLGLSNVIVYADPHRDLVVSFLNTGKPMMAPGMLLWQGVLQSISATVPRGPIRGALGG